ncbi:MAG: hypothetical protein AUH72_18770 [Acidobacteria bacterium 13_1_40CM_4_65_8]|nr:MAG: hypothetical protein AUH72_18770 [Acidobacteria bacterium 13_1_40CM_4_65_8]
MNGSSPAVSRGARTAEPSDTTVTPAGEMRRAYPRVRTAGCSPLSRSSRAMYSTIGVLPLPPTSRLPTLTTGRMRRCRRDASRAYHRRRHAAAAP